MNTQIQTLRIDGTTGYSINPKWKLTMKEMETIAELEVVEGSSVVDELTNVLHGCILLGERRPAFETLQLIKKILEHESKNERFKFQTYCGKTGLTV